jgi:hypothetical protein
VAKSNQSKLVDDEEEKEEFGTLDNNEANDYVVLTDD